MFTLVIFLLFNKKYVSVKKAILRKPNWKKSNAVLTKDLRATA